MHSLLGKMQVVCVFAPLAGLTRHHAKTLRRPVALAAWMGFIA